MLVDDLRCKGRVRGRQKFYDALKLVKRLVNLGDAKSLCCHPASTTHRQMSAEEQRKAGVRPETIRLSIGIETSMTSWPTWIKLSTRPNYKRNSDLSICWGCCFHRNRRPCNLSISA